MIKITPARVLVDLDGSPLRTGEIKDLAVRLKLAALKDAAAAAQDGKRSVLEEHYLHALREAQPPLTLGAVIIAALQAALDGDDKVDIKTKVERDDLCIVLFKAERDGKQAELTAENVVDLKGRVARLYVPRVVGQVVRCLEGKEAPGE